MKYNLISIVGPTATGKTGLGTRLAQKLNGEILSADSRQVYKFMDIGTGKDLEEYTIDGNLIPYHLIDVALPEEEFDLFHYQKLFYKTLAKIRANRHIPLLVGGTGMYISAVIQNYDLVEVDFNSRYARELMEKPEDELKKILFSKTKKHHNTTDLLEKERIIKAIIVAEGKGNYPESKREIHSLNICVDTPPDIVRDRIKKRLASRLEQGMVEEVQALLDMGISHEKLRFFGLEYRYLSMYLAGEINYNDMFQKLYSAISQFAKRQRTWFRKIERDGVVLHRISGPDFEAAYDIIIKNIKNFEFEDDFITG